ncbi:MAG: MotA/TolQ/ExbB proton channel family protein [Desulfonauticus sp.]|nr:MotA/TolQ/ExbB proton channel family protein [Desulfonauticus sp.]
MGGVFNVTLDSSAVLNLLSNATLAVKIVLFILLCMSVFSWTIIFYKLFLFSFVKGENRRFFQLFNDIYDFKKLENFLETNSNKVSARFLLAGLDEFKKIGKSSLPLNVKIKILEDNLKRALLNGKNLELLNLKRGIPFLATCSNSAPFIGLFGTVWGIMHSFHSIGLQKTASLATVAPGISEALIATAFGLVVAIPATMAYNYFLSKLQDINTDFELFANLFLNHIQRNLLAIKGEDGE